MDTSQFVRKWAASTRSERAASQEHFINLCELLGEDTPNSDPSGDYYAFEKGTKTPDGDGWADVWQNLHFAWEYKGKHKDLVAAYAQIQKYREALDNPPLLVVCDLERFEVHTNWTSNESWVYKFNSAGIASGEHVAVETIVGAPARDAPELTALQVLKALFREPELLKPQRTRDEITREAAKEFGKISDALRKWGVPDERMAGFIMRLVFCMFATDVGLLPRETFSEIIRVHKKSGDAPNFRKHLSDLFAAMNTGGDILMHRIPHFNGRLFEDNDVPEAITAQEIHILADLDAMNWADVEPSIFGTLFEWVIDPKQRKMLGAHYTSRDDIELIVEPVLMEPLRHEWRLAQASIANVIEKAQASRAKPETWRVGARASLKKMQDRIASIRVLDPACGSGNFLYVSLGLLKALEKEIIAFGAAYEIAIKPRVHPKQLYGIETNALAHQLASIVIWIGYLQWKSQNAMPLLDEDPILQPLDNIAGKDALLHLSNARRPKEMAWPEADVIVGNPPFVGGKLLKTRLGDDYVEKLFAVYDGRVARESDLCCYWFEKAREAIEGKRAKRAGLLATQAIRGGANRKVLERIKESGDIFYAQADRPWVQDGVAVRVSMVGFDNGAETRRRLNEETGGDARNALLRSRAVEGINANLTYQADTTTAQRLRENADTSFIGDQKTGPFDIAERVARRMLEAPNPHGKPNSDVVRPWVNGLDITRRNRGMWIVDFPPGMSERDAALYETPFEFAKKHVRPERIRNRRARTAKLWWIHAEPRPGMRDALAGRKRYLGTPRLTKYRLFAWLDARDLSDSQLVVFARSDDYFFGVLHSRVHEAWARATGTQLREAESGFRYTPTSCFETFPFPHATQEQQWAISIAAKDLNDLRERWLNPEGMIGAKELAKRTLTNLYNERPTWLANAHRTLDEAVFAAYGWREAPGDLPDADITARLLALNLARDPA